MHFACPWSSNQIDNHPSCLHRWAQHWAPQLCRTWTFRSFDKLHESCPLELKSLCPSCPPVSTKHTFCFPCVHVSKNPKFFHLLSLSSSYQAPSTNPIRSLDLISKRLFYNIRPNLSISPFFYEEIRVSSFWEAGRWWWRADNRN